MTKNGLCPRDYKTVGEKQNVDAKKIKCGK